MPVVKFQCPNGHPLSAPPSLAGKTGKCPKCGAGFMVPEADEGSGSAPRLDIKMGSAIATGPGSQPNQQAFVFLCPNGHKLNGPPSLKGKLGQCPHCKARFRIPEDEPEEDEEPLAEPVEESEESGDEISPDELEMEEPEPPFEKDVHPLAHIIGRLWRHKGESGEIEILLPEGEIMLPEHFSPGLSAREYGVFATREGNGFSFSVVPWETVRRVNVHKVEHLPLGAFPD